MQYQFAPHCRNQVQLDRLASLLTTSIELTECLLRKSTDSISHRERIKLCYSQYCNNPSSSNQNNCDAKVITKMIRRTLGMSLRNTGFQKSSKGIHYNGSNLLNDVGGTHSTTTTEPKREEIRPKRWQYSDPLQACITTNCQGLRKVPFYQCAYQKCIAEEEE